MEVRGLGKNLILDLILGQTLCQPKGLGLVASLCASHQPTLTTFFQSLAPSLVVAGSP